MLSFLPIFFFAFIIQILRNKFFTLTKVLKSVQSKDTKSKPEFVVPESPLEQEIKALESELQQMRIEAEKNNHPDGYAIYGKLQRQIVQKERILDAKKKENAEVQKQNAMFYPQPQQSSSGFLNINKPFLILTLCFYFFGFVVPLFFLPRAYTMSEIAVPTNIEPGLVSPLSSQIGTFISYKDITKHFVHFRSAYIISMVVSQRLISLASL